nr:MAG TPA: hypothetical protein [Caudoviricetes sp.]
MAYKRPPLLYPLVLSLLSIYLDITCASMFLS